MQYSLTFKTNKKIMEQEQIKSAPRIRSFVKHITPDIAKFYLKYNVANRPLRKDIVELYSKQMKDGLWKVSNDAISFDEDGKLVNGQHRLHAVVDSNVACDFLVTSGLDRESFAVMDNGIIRTSGNVFYLQGIQYYRLSPSIIKRKMILESNMAGEGGGNTKKGNAQILQEYNNHQEDYNKICKDAMILYDKSRLLTATDYGGYIAYLTFVKKHPYTLAHGFFKEFAEIEKATNDVVILLRQRLLNDKLSAVKMTRLSRVKLIIKAWNAYVTGKTVKLLKYVEATDKDIWFI